MAQVFDLNKNRALFEAVRDVRKLRDETANKPEGEKKPADQKGIIVLDNLIADLKQLAI